jgi:magnesium chelatase subunit H
MCWVLADKYLGLAVGIIPQPQETPNKGLLHPDYQGYFLNPQAYWQWYQTRSPLDLTQSPIVAILIYRKHVITHQPYIAQLITAFEQEGVIPVPIFINGVEGHIIVRDWLTTTYEQAQRSKGTIETLSLEPEAIRVDAIVSTIGFPLVGGPAGSMEAGRQVETAKRILSAKNIPYFIAAPLLIQDIASWTRQGIGGLQSVVLYSLPELDGAIDTVPLGGLVGEDIYLIPERIKRLTGRLKKWVNLHRLPPSQRKIAIILYGFPPGYGATGTAALLNVPRSLIRFLQALRDQGYDVGLLPEEGEALISQVKIADEAVFTQESLAENPIAGRTSITPQTLEQWLGYLLTSRIQKQWRSLSETGLKTYGQEFQIGGVQLGNIWIGVQPPLGIAGDPMRLLFEKDLTPHPQYAAYYQWLQRDWQADAVVHFGMHGTVEWLPGSPLGNTGYSWSDILVGNLPNLYIYAANNPSESILAKRRGYGVLISHNVPPYGRAGLYKELVTLRELIAEFREDPETNLALRDIIAQKILDTGIDRDCKFEEGLKQGIEFNLENIRLFSKYALRDYFVKVYEYLQVLEQRLFSSGLHTLGEAPDREQLTAYLDAYFGDRLSEREIEIIINYSDEIKDILTLSPNRREILEEAITIRDLLQKNTDELTNLLRGLNGEYIAPSPGGDLLRDGAGALPTGRNIHALDPYRMPSPGAFERGRTIARKLINQHILEDQTYPETVAVMLWGLDAIKTKGESLGIILELVGAEPVKEGTGRIVRYDLISLDRLDHPRIDVLVNLSGIFRDTFVNIIELLDDLFARAAIADEPEAQNYIRKHSQALENQGIDNSSARLFSNPAGDFGSLVNDQIVDSNWETRDELADTWRKRNVYSYGRNDKGQARPEILDQLLKTSDRIIQEIDSVEYGLTDIQEYYGNTGGLKLAAEKQKGKRITASFVESFSNDLTPRKLEDVLRLEYRSKLLNPRWAEAMAKQGSGGAYEISQRMTALVGWGGTTDFTDDWVYDQAAEAYAFDKAMATRLQAANPEAFRNIVGRMIEAHGRGFWQVGEDKLQKLRSLYESTEDQLEGVQKN